ncbi:MAG: hypothetical protein ABIZ96_03685 [Gemmatimonadales bacterium]
MNVLQRVGGSVLLALLASACTEQSMTDESSAKDRTGLAPSFLVANASVDIQFEPLEFPPWYIVGKIHLQDDWSSAGPYDHFVVVNALAAPAYNYPTFGSQSLRISNAITSGSFGDQTFSKRTPNYAGETTSDCSTWCLPGGTRQSHFEVEQDFASTVPTAEQPGLAVTVSPDRGDGARMSFVRLRDESAGLAVDFVDVQGGTGGPTACGEANFVEATGIATGLNRAVPHTIKITMDLLEGPSNDVVKVYVDGNLEHTGTSWEDYYRYDCEAVAHLGHPPAVNRILYRTSSNPPAPATLLRGFVFDNLSLGTLGVSKDACKNGGWQSLTRADDSPFKNQGDCIQYANKGK